MLGMLTVIQEAVTDCPGCIVNSSPGLMDGMFWGLVFMMVTPFLVLLVFAGGLAKAKREDLRLAGRRFSDEAPPQPSDGATTPAGSQS